MVCNKYIEKISHFPFDKALDTNLITQTSVIKENSDQIIEMIRMQMICLLRTNEHAHHSTGPCLCFGVQNDTKQNGSSEFLIYLFFYLFVLFFLILEFEI